MVPIQCDAISWSPNTAEPGEQGITYTQLQGPLKSGRESRAVHYTYQVVGLRNSDSDTFPPLWPIHLRRGFREVTEEPGDVNWKLAEGANAVREVSLAISRGEEDPSKRTVDGKLWTLIMVLVSTERGPVVRHGCVACISSHASTLLRERCSTGAVNNRRFNISSLLLPQSSISVPLEDGANIVLNMFVFADVAP